MNDIKQKALALLNDVLTERGFAPVGELYGSVLLGKALCRAIEQHEAFRQEVSDALLEYYGAHLVAEDGGDALARLVIPAPKPDPLVVVAESMGYYGDDAIDLAEAIRVAMDARGLGIREKNDD